MSLVSTYSLAKYQRIAAGTAALFVIANAIYEESDVLPRENHMPAEVNMPQDIEMGATSTQVRYGPDLEIPFSEAQREPIIPIPISGKIKVRFKKATPLQYIPVEDENGFI